MISGPSGAGKSTIVAELLKVNKDLVKSVSCTTRKRRKGEIQGKSYYFISEEEFKEKVDKGEFLEWAMVHGSFYGTPLNFIKESLAQKKNIILEIDVQGAKVIKEKVPDAVLIFVLPPSLKELRSRLLARNTEDDASLSLRLKNALLELREVKSYDYVVVNDRLERTVEEITQIINKVKN